jgi:hypothetical protein
MSFDLRISRLLGPILILIIGLALLGVGLFGLTWAATGFSREAAQVAALRPSGAAELAVLPPGSPALVAGLVAADAEVGAGGLAAYLVEEPRGEPSGAGEERWRTREVVAPPLALELGDGRVPIANAGYELRLASAAPAGSAQGANGLRYRGLAPGSPALAYGVVARGGAGPALEARWLFGGDQAAFVAEQRANASAARASGLIFGALGLLGLGGGAWLLRGQLGG